MKNPRRWPSILIFVIMQVAWLTMVILWIIWYVRNHYALIQRIGTWDILILVEGSVLLTLILACAYILFILYQKQLTLMKTQIYLISSITHEFKTPLATMQLYLETMQKRDLPAETRDQFVAGMLSENQRLKSMVEKFLESARSKYHNRPYQLQALSAESFIQTFLNRHNALLAGVDIHQEIEPGIYLNLDIDAFDMAFSNLAENAVYYTLGHPHIGIKIWRDKKTAHIEFSDHGIGIPKERQKDIFQLFRRLPEGVALQAKGTGMGLYVTRAIIKAHGGKIRLKRNEPDNGSCFIITLPLAKVDA